MPIAPEMETNPRSRKSGKHPNSHAREVIMQALYQLEVAHHSVNHVLELDWLNERMEWELEDFCRDIIQGVAENQDALDRVIQTFSHKHLTQISIITLCILRMAIFEMQQTELEARIIIDDLLNLTRKYDGDESVGFVNGILDRYEKERLAQLDT